MDPTTFLFCLTAFGACVAGKLCGMGGGVIIKPILDAFGVLSVDTINFLSGCTVLSMTCWSVGRSVTAGARDIDFRCSTPLALGAALGGALGKRLYAFAETCFADADMAGGVQACILFAATLATLIYTLRKERITSYRVSSRAACCGIGLALGILGAFLGIGGGPFNMAVLYFFFSMPTKTAVQNSLYIILFSQAASLLQTLLTGTLPLFSGRMLVGMVLCAVIGSELGGIINEKLTDRAITRLFECTMAAILCINLYNIWSYLLRKG